MLIHSRNEVLRTMTDYMKSMIKRTREAVTKEVTEKVNKNFIEILKLIKAEKSVDEIKALHPEFDKNYIRELRNLILTN